MAEDAPHKPSRRKEEVNILFLCNMLVSSKSNVFVRIALLYVPLAFRAPLQERADYVDEILPLVLDSADKPFDVCSEHFPVLHLCGWVESQASVSSPGREVVAVSRQSLADSGLLH